MNKKSKIKKYTSYEEYDAAVPDKHDQYIQQASVIEWSQVGGQPSLVKKLEQGWSPEEKDRLAQGKEQCPMCFDFGFFTFDERGATENTENIFRRTFPTCFCLKWKHLQSILNREIPADFSFVNLLTLKPNLLSSLPEEAQQKEIEVLREIKDTNIFFLGPTGTGKTTFCYALFKYAHERDINKFWVDDRPLTFDQNRWIWRINFDRLMNQYALQSDWTAKVKAPEPYVTVEKIHRAVESGHRPFLILEEIDKTKLNDTRAKSLFGLIDAMKEVQGQLIMTTNRRSLSDFAGSFENTDLVGYPLIRRLTQNVEIRNHYQYLK